MQHAIYLFYHNSRLFDHFVDYKVYACHVTEYFFFFFVDVMIFMHLTSLDLCSF